VKESFHYCKYAPTWFIHINLGDLMNKVIIPVLIIILAVVAISGCTEQAQNKTYSANGVTFQYPENWTELNETEYQTLDLGSNIEVIFILGNEQTALTFEKVIPGQNQVLNTLPGWAQAIKSMLSSRGAQLLSEKNLTVAGVDAYQLRFRSTDGYYYTSTAFIKNNTGYVLMYTSTSNETRTLDNILNSFQME
jgi:hypothetical protein